MTARVVTSTRGSSVWLTPCCGSIQRAAKKRARKRGAKRRSEERSALDLVAILAGGELLDVLAVLGGHEGLGNAEKNT